jgi:hypothetical protein
LALMPYTTTDARMQLLSSVAEATKELGAALAALSEAYELLDDATADRMERELFGPVQMAYGRAQRTHSAFAQRHNLPGRAFESAVAGAPSHGVKGFIDSAVSAVSSADRVLATLQDSMLPVEVGDPELRAGLEQVRELIGPLNSRARELLRTLGR